MSANILAYVPERTIDDGKFERNKAKLAALIRLVYSFRDTVKVEFMPMDEHYIAAVNSVNVLMNRPRSVTWLLHAWRDVHEARSRTGSPQEMEVLDKCLLVLYDHVLLQEIVYRSDNGKSFARAVGMS